MLTIIIITAVASFISLIVDPKKTIKGVKKGLMQFIKILPTLLSVIIIISIVLHFVSNDLIVEYLGKGAGWEAYFSAVILGTVSQLPGSVVYPLAGILISSGVNYAVIAVFITTIVMVKVLIIPIEAKYFGIKVTLIRNALNFLGALIVGFTMVIIYQIVLT